MANDYEKTRYGACSICGEHGIVNDHHWLRRSKLYEKLYPEFINDKENLKKSVCQGCHEYLRNISEVEFCKIFKIVPLSKEGKLIWGRMES